METQYLHKWLIVIEQMNSDNTYKLAWGRSIVECVAFDKYTIDDKNVIVEFDEISKCMIKYYWNQLFFFNLKQSPYTDKDPIICKYTNVLIEEYKRLSKCNFLVWFDEGIKLLCLKEYAVIISKLLNYKWAQL